jgi:hypothetical protein
MNRVPATGGVVLALVFGLTPIARAEDAKGLDVPGAFSIAAPGPGFEWRQVKVAESRGVKAVIYTSIGRPRASRGGLPRSRGITPA